MADEIVTVGSAVRFKRMKKGMSARKLSRLAGLSPSYVNKIEKEEVGPSFAIFCRLADVLEMSDAEILFLVKKSMMAQAQSVEA